MADLYDEDREYDMEMDQLEREAEVIEAHFREHGLDIKARMYSQRCLLDIEVPASELARTPITSRLIVDIMKSLDDADWKCTGASVAQDMSVAGDPFTGIRVKMQKPVSWS